MLKAALEHACMPCMQVSFLSSSRLWGEVDKAAKQNLTQLYDAVVFSNKWAEKLLWQGVGGEGGWRGEEGEAGGSLMAG